MYLNRPQDKRGNRQAFNLKLSTFVWLGCRTFAVSHGAASDLGGVSLASFPGRPGNKARVSHADMAEVFIKCTKQPNLRPAWGHVHGEATSRPQISKQMRVDRDNDWSTSCIRNSTSS